MKAAEVKDALRRRHPAAMQGSMVGQWTCIEEWAEIDLLAIDAWSNGAVVGYEVKVSRSDFRQEILRPAKRADAVAMCTEFYFAVPTGLLKPEELAYETPDWAPEDFERQRCPGIRRFGPPASRYTQEYRDWERARERGELDLLAQPPGRYGGPCHGRGRTGSYKAGQRERGPFTVPLPVPDVLVPPEYVTSKWERGGCVELEGAERDAAIAKWAADHRRYAVIDGDERLPCPRCRGKGYLERSRVENEAPTLWVPRDVGLIEITARGCRVTKKAPRRPDAPGLIDPDRFARLTPRQRRQLVGHIVRWVSNRPDPRHVPAESPGVAVRAA